MANLAILVLFCVLTLVCSFALRLWTGVGQTDGRAVMSAFRQRMTAHRKKMTVRASSLDIYEKIIDIFEKEKPYLNSEFSEKMLVRKIGTNRVYLSRALKLHAHNNFCGFVNSYRINYAIRMFAQNQTLRVSDLAYMSGFNSTTSFNGVFKGLMHVTPGQWCIQYRRKLNGV